LILDFPMTLLFAGSGEFGLPTLKALLDAGHTLAHVYSQPDRPAGRGRTLTPTPIAQFALERSLPLTRTDNLNAALAPSIFTPRCFPRIAAPRRSTGRSFAARR
jgi:methionyl-tRNA formyltransferase